MTATRETVKTSILILSDTHASDLSRERHEAICCCPPFPKVDIALHCGDLTRAGRLKEHEKTIELLASIDAEYKFVIAGNHDLSLDENYMRHHRLRLLTQRDTEITACATIWKSDETKRKGIRYLDEGIHAFQLKNGAMLNLYASPYSPEFYDWAFMYRLDEDRWNPAEHVSPNDTPVAQNPIPDFPQVDVVMTHGPPAGHLDVAKNARHVGCKHLLRALQRARPQLHCFGHIHESWGAERLHWKVGKDGEEVPETAGKDKISAEMNGGSDGKRGLVSSIRAAKSLKEVQIDRKKCWKDGYAAINLSKTAQEPLQRGCETLLVNASIMDMFHRPFNAPWLIELDLPKAAM